MGAALIGSPEWQKVYHGGLLVQDRRTVSAAASTVGKRFPLIQIAEVKSCADPLPVGEQRYRLPFPSVLYTLSVSQPAARDVYDRTLYGFHASRPDATSD
jgi:hypothetical protein